MKMKTHLKNAKRKPPNPPSISHDEAMQKMIRADREFAREPLKAAFEDHEVPEVFFTALRRVA